MIYAIFLQNGLSMDISTTASSKSYSPYIAWPKHHLQNQKSSLKQKINGSYAFTTGNQSCDEQYNKLFIDLFREMRGGDRIVDESSWTLANSLCDERISDRKERVIYEPEEKDRIEVSYHPTEEFKKELRNLLDLHDGLSDQFLEALQDNQKKLKDNLDLKARDTYCAIPILSRVFPRFYETLQGIFADLLAVEYLDDHNREDRKIGLLSILNNEGNINWILYEEDNSDSFHTCLDNEKNLWEQALAVGYSQKQRDAQLAVEHEKAWASDKNNLLISAGISGATGNPIFLVAQTLRNIANAIARNTDPEREDVLTQALPLVTNTASAAINGITKELAVRLALDLADLASDRKDGDFAISMSKALITGCVHGDEERYIKEILSAVLSEASSNVSSETLVGAALKHPDVHGLFVDHFLEKQRPKPQEIEESKTQDPEFPVESEPKITTQIEEIERIDQQKARELEAQKQYEQELAEYNKKLEEHYERERMLNTLVEERNEKQAGVMSAMWYLTDKVEKYQDNYKKDKYYSKLKQAVKNVNNNFAERDAVDNRINAFLGNQTTVSTPPMKTPKRASKWEKTKLWIDRNLEISINVSTTKPLYNTKTPNVSDGPIDRSPPTLPEKPKPIEFSFQDVQKVQEQRILETNMAYKTQNAIQPQQTQYSPNIGQWEQGVAIKSSPIQSASFFPMPRRIERAIDNHVQKTVAEIRQSPLKAKKDQLIGLFLGAKNVAIATVQAFEQPSLKRKNGGLEKLSLVIDKKIATQFNVDLESQNTKIGIVVGEVFTPIGMLGRTGRVAKIGEEFLFARAVNAKQLKLIKPVYHSGIGNPFSEMIAVERPLPTKTIEQLKNRSIKQIRTDWVFPKKGGATINGRWYTEHALERMAPRTPEVMAELESRFVERAKIASGKLPHEDFLKWYKKNYPNPRGIPPSVIETEIARPGSTGVRVVLNENGDIVTAIPGGL